MNPTLPEAFRRAILKGRNLAPNGDALTLEFVTQIFRNGQIQVACRNWGPAVIPVTGEGLRTLRPGSKVAVAWEKGRPVTAIAHTAKRSGAPVPLPALAGGIVEELFIAGEEGARDVYFRNDQQVTALAIRAQLPSDPVRVRWGESMRHFVVETGAPTAGDQAAAAGHPFTFLRVTKQYHLFEITDGNDPLAVLGDDEPAVVLRGTFTPYADDLVVVTVRIEYVLDQQVDGQTLEENVTVSGEEDDPPPPAGGASWADVTMNSLSFITTPGPGLITAASERTYTLADLLNGANAEDGSNLWYALVEDFGATRTGHLWLALQAKFHVVSHPGEEATQSVSLTVVWIQEGGPDPDDAACAVPSVVATTPLGEIRSGLLGSGATAANGGSFGESHRFVVDLTGRAVAWSTTGPAPLLRDEEAVANAFQPFQSRRVQDGEFIASHFVPDGMGGGEQVTESLSAALFVLDPAGNGIDQACRAPSAVTPAGDEAALAGALFGTEEFPDAFPSGFALRRKHLFDAAVIPFIEPDTIVMDAPSEAITHLFYKVGNQDIQVFLDPDNSTTPQPAPDQQRPPAGTHLLNVPGGTTPWLGIDRTVRAWVPEPVWTYRVRTMTVLDMGSVGLGPALFALVVDRIQQLDDVTFEKELGLFVVSGVNQLVATLRPFTSTDPGGGGSTPDEFAGGTLQDDGSDAEILSGNRFHVLWTLSTAAERAANIRHIKLSRIDPGPVATIEVGANWPEFQTHDFRILNLDVLYAAKDDDLHKFFVDAWDAETGAPTLSQTAEGYPIEDTELEPVKPLADLDEDTPAAITRELQAVNDEEALAQTGRELKPEVV